MAATLKTVAAKAGISVSTASRALRSSPRVSAATQKHVKRVAVDIGYRPNQAARALRSGESRLIGLVLNNLLNVSFHTIAEVVQQRLSVHGYQLILSTTSGDAGVERELLMKLTDHGVDGVIVIGSGKNSKTLNSILQSGVPVVNVIRSSPDSLAPTVLAGDRDGASMATEYLVSLGHRRIGYVGGLETTDSGRERYLGYISGLNRNGIEVDEIMVRRGPFDPEFGAKAIEELLATENGMTALFAANHEAVFGILPVLAARGISLPQNLSVICYEDMPLLQTWQPAITVIDTGATEIAELTVDLILKQVSNLKKSSEGKRKQARTYRVGASLIARHSCASPSKLKETESPSPIMFEHVPPITPRAVR